MAAAVCWHDGAALKQKNTFKLNNNCHSILPVDWGRVWRRIWRQCWMLLLNETLFKHCYISSTSAYLLYLCVCLSVCLSFGVCRSVLICMSFICVWLTVCASRLVHSANTSLVQYANELAQGQRVRAQTGDRIIAQLCLIVCVCVRESMYSLCRQKPACVCFYFLHQNPFSFQKIMHCSTCVCLECVTAYK